MMAQLIINTGSQASGPRLETGPGKMIPTSQALQHSQPKGQDCRPIVALSIAL